MTSKTPEAGGVNEAIIQIQDFNVGNPNKTVYRICLEDDFDGARRSFIVDRQVANYIHERHKQISELQSKNESLEREIAALRKRQ